MRIAVIGGGVSGAVCARLLASRHEVTLFEGANYLGGHAQTLDVELEGRRYAADAAFMVFNERTYPNFCRMLELLGVASRPSDMSFSVRCDQSGLEYQGGSLSGLFAQRRNLLRPSFFGMLADILRFNSAATRDADNLQSIDGLTVGEYTAKLGLGGRFRCHYLGPMAAAIWSSNPEEVLSFPASFLVGFFRNHGLLQLSDRPQWRTICGGSRRYVEALLRPLVEAGGCRLNAPVAEVRRESDSVSVRLNNGCAEQFDHVVLATHADASLRVLADATPTEKSVLASFPFRENRAVLHTDSRMLPKRRTAWASWNYRIASAPGSLPTVTYDLSRLQGLATTKPLLLTLNPVEEIAPDRVIRELSYSHPAFSTDSLSSQTRWREISGADRVHFCGAYWGFGFHEDGVRSALAVTGDFNIGINACTAACTRAPSRTTAGVR